MDLTAIHYTANQKPASFVAKMQTALRASLRGVPVVSVSHRPMDFGTNICVGDVGLSIHNVWRQLQIGAQHATTRFVCSAEDDTLYPPDYFTFRPPRDDTFYLAEPAYHLFSQKNRIHFFAYNRRGDEGAMMVNREFLIARIDQLLAGLPTWSPPVKPLHLFKGCREERFELATPILEFRNDFDLHRRCKHDRSHRVRVLAPFGDCLEMITAYS